jgi:D-3-phosphoglycerate dehydrogenase / 2-oxoglutarate reductase
MRVLVADKLSPSVREALENAGCAVIVEAGAKGDALSDALARSQAQVLVVRSTEVRAPQLHAAPELALVIRAGAGVNTIDVDEASRRGIYVANCPGKNAVAVAELTLLHLLNLDRRLADGVAELRAHRWNKAEYGRARGLHGRTLAVLGVGDIGREVIARAQAFGMKVRAWSRSLGPDDAAALGVTHCRSPREACSGAHALSIHLALTPQTRGLVGRELLEALAPGAFVVNTSRGEVLDQDALIQAIRSRGLRAGLDVFAEEPAGGAGDFPYAIADEPAVYGTHHIGASTEQAEDAVGDEVVRIVRAFLQSGEVPNCVNLAEKSPATHLLVVRHADRVGVLASVLGALREHEVNVQEMENIVFRGAAAACARIQVDGAPPAAALALIAQNPDVYATSVVELEA